MFSGGRTITKHTLLALAIISAALMGCQPDTPAAEATPATGAASGEAVTEEASSAIRLIVWADALRAPIVEALETDLLAEHHVELIVEEMPFGDIRDRLAEDGPAGEGPDILIGAHEWLGYLAANDLVAPIDLGDREDEFLAPAVEAFTYDGALYGIPYATENAAFVCNTDLLEMADADVPATWDDVTALAEALEAESGGDVTAWAIQSNDPYHFNPLLTAFGGSIFGASETGYDPADVGLDSEGGIAAGEWLQAMAEEGHITGSLDHDALHALFYEGAVACIGTDLRALEGIRESGINYAIGPYPEAAQPAAPFLSVHGFMVSAFSENQGAAQAALLDLVATEAFMTALYEADPRPSAYLAVRRAIDDLDVAGFAEAGANGQPMPAIPEMALVWEPLGSGEERVITLESDGETAMIEAAAQIRAAIAGE